MITIVPIMVPISGVSPSAPLWVIIPLLITMIFIVVGFGLLIWLEASYKIMFWFFGIALAMFPVLSIAMKWWG